MDIFNDRSLIGDVQQRHVVKEALMIYFALNKWQSQQRLELGCKSKSPV